MFTKDWPLTPGPWVWKEVPLPGVKPDPIDPNPTCWVLVGEGGDGEAVLRHQAPWRLGEANAKALQDAPDLLARAEKAEQERNGARAALVQIVALDNYSRESSLEASIGDAMGVGEALGRIEAATIARRVLDPVPENLPDEILRSEDGRKP